MVGHLLIKLLFVINGSNAKAVRFNFLVILLDWISGRRKQVFLSESFIIQ